MKDFESKVVVITGGATGIGFSLAKQFGKEGAKIVVASRRLNRVEEAVNKLLELKIDATGTTCDVAEEQQIKELLQYCLDFYGQVDVLINNAGIVGTNNKPVIEITNSEVERVLGINVKGTWNGVRVFGKYMIDRGEECAIYNVGSENSFFKSVPHGGEYVASKHAVLGMTVALRDETPDYFQVGIIAPGLVVSEIDEVTAVGMNTDKYASVVIEQIKAEQFYIVSHAYNIRHITDRYNEMNKAYATYAPRYDNDDEFDVMTLVKKMEGKLEANHTAGKE